jgi:hypothetical protein
MNFKSLLVFFDRSSWTKEKTRKTKCILWPTCSHMNRTERERWDKASYIEILLQLCWRFEGWKWDLLSLLEVWGCHWDSYFDLRKNIIRTSGETRMMKIIIVTHWHLVLPLTKTVWPLSNHSAKVKEDDPSHLSMFLLRWYSDQIV